MPGELANWAPGTPTTMSMKPSPVTSPTARLSPKRSPAAEPSPETGCTEYPPGRSADAVAAKARPSAKTSASKLTLRRRPMDAARKNYLFPEGNPCRYGQTALPGGAPDYRLRECPGRQFSP